VLILLTNDDGVYAPGLAALENELQAIADICLVAPATEQSGVGHSITFLSPLVCHEIFDGAHRRGWAVEGSPADCVKLGVTEFCPRRPDLVVSGINHGSNTSISVLYSGTMSAAIEAAIENMPAIGFSLCDYESNADMDHVDEFVLKIAREALTKDMGHGVALNVNLPAKRKESIQGIKICRQANAKWQEDFDQRIDPYGRKYFWMTGNFVNHDKSEDNDEWAIANNYVSVVPCQFDLTSYHAMNLINDGWNFD